MTYKLAHEVNNTVGPVNSILHFTLKSHENVPSLTDALNIAIDRNNNLNTFMRNFADLARLTLPLRKPVELIGLSKNTTELMQLRAGTKKIIFHHNHAEERLVIKMDGLQIEQALINIIKKCNRVNTGRGEHYTNYTVFTPPINY